MSRTNVDDFDPVHHLAKYRAQNWKALFHAGSTFAGFVVGALLHSLHIIPTVVFIILQTLFLMKAFIIYHDAGHNSFFTSIVPNRITEILFGTMTLSPTTWNEVHAKHHRHNGELYAEYSFSDTVLLTVAQYKTLPSWKRIAYRVVRDPISFFFVVPILNFFIRYRFPEELRHFPTIMMSNVLIFLSHYWIYSLGATTYWVHIFSLYISAIIGFIMFHLQHSFNPGFVTESKNWNRRKAALYGCSIFILPRWLKFFTMGIEYHTLHHFSTKVPGYLLEECYNAAPPGFFNTKELASNKYREIWQSLQFTLFDTEKNRYVSFGEVESEDKSKEKKGGTGQEQREGKERRRKL